MVLFPRSFGLFPRSLLSHFSLFLFSSPPTSFSRLCSCFLLPLPPDLALVFSFHFPIPPSQLLYPSFPHFPITLSPTFLSFPPARTSSGNVSPSVVSSIPLVHFDCLQHDEAGPTFESGHLMVCKQNAGCKLSIIFLNIVQLTFSRSHFIFPLHRYTSASSLAPLSAPRVCVSGDGDDVLASERLQRH